MRMRFCIIVKAIWEGNVHNHHENNITLQNNVLKIGLILFMQNNNSYILPLDCDLDMFSYSYRRMYMFSLHITKKHYASSAE